MTSKILHFIEEKHNKYPGTIWALIVVMVFCILTFILFPHHFVIACILGFLAGLGVWVFIWLWFLEGTKLGDFLLKVRGAIKYAFDLLEKLSNSLKKASDTYQKQNPSSIHNILTIAHCDGMTGRTFEYYLKELFELMGHKTKLTTASNDQGADVIVWMNEKKYAVQAKRYKGNVGNKAVQEVYSAKAYYGCHAAMVVTNSYFTDSAKRLAESTGVELADRSELQRWLKRYHVYIK
ncbi:restriction endonuclease [Bacillus sp. S2(2024)]|uniref:restriction endonuclease n=1 Tax=Bacillus sp. S2(2024) TaxID=3162887 RepID=UPI003D196E0D